MKFVVAPFFFMILAGCASHPISESTQTASAGATPAPTPYVAPVSSLPSKVENLAIPNTDVILKKKQGVALRGNSPRDLKDLVALKDYGVTQVIIFKNDKRGEVKTEIAQLKELGYQDTQIHHIPFDWKDNSDFKAACLKFVGANSIMDAAIAKNEKTFMHCTTGEDRTGAASAIYQMTHNKKLSIDKVFSQEMCLKGYEAGEPHKPKEVVEKIRAGLTKTFLKMAYQVQWAHKHHLAVNESLCDNDPTNRKDFLKSPYSKSENFYCK